MTKFDSDFAIFGTLTADITDSQDIGEGIITYANQACIDLYGDLRGNTVLDMFCNITGSLKKGTDLVRELKSKGSIVIEGKLNDRFIKYHCRVVRSSGPDGNKKDFIQSGITDLTESVILKKLLYGTSEALKRAAKAADEDTGYHINRINHYSGHIAELLGKEDKFVEDITTFAQLHDIGKINVAELIRLPRKLTAKEFDEVKKHTIYGAKMVEGLEGLEMAYNIALDHHEKWDGSGYPNNKKGEHISLEGRIVTISDIFDALVSPRAYKPAFDYKTTYEILLKGDERVAPQHFDPDIYNAFISNYDYFVEMHKKMKK